MLVTDSCFMDCRGCYLDKKDGEPLSAEENIRFAAILKSLGYEAITFSGGDPLARHDIHKIVKAVDAMGFTIHLDTTGKPFLHDNPEAVFPASDIAKTVDLIGIPLDGSSDEIMQRFRTGTLSETLKILSLLDGHRCPISINTVVHRGNVDDLANIYEVITKYAEIIRWELHQFVALGERSKLASKDLEISDDDFAQAVAGIKNFRGIIISPKPRQNKHNFTYLDFNGDLVRVKGDTKDILFNIRKLSSEELLLKILYMNDAC